mmetsp:Transcript_2905/g.6347  ORF Transcript_2905/g.6347 Transcript_2905/m.6347 type:complete len:168 (-) Transcript_2905:576-1079(-)
MIKSEASVACRLREESLRPLPQEKRVMFTLHLGIRRQRSLCALRWKRLLKENKFDPVIQVRETILRPRLKGSSKDLELRGAVAGPIDGGAVLGEAEGIFVGLFEGPIDGAPEFVGEADGECVGLLEGLFVGDALGGRLGGLLIDGDLEGNAVGKFDEEGVSLGAELG